MFVKGGITMMWQIIKLASTANLLMKAQASGPRVSGITRWECENMKMLWNFNIKSHRSSTLTIQRHEHQRVAVAALLGQDPFGTILWVNSDKFARLQSQLDQARAKVFRSEQSFVIIHPLEKCEEKNRWENVKMKTHKLSAGWHWTLKLLTWYDEFGESRQPKQLPLFDDRDLESQNSVKIKS